MVKFLLSLFVSLFCFHLVQAQVQPSANLVITKTVSPGPYLPDNFLTFTLRVSNAGPDQASGVVVTDLLPAELAFVSATASAGNYLPASGAWTVNTLANGAAETLTLVARVKAPAGTTVRTSATVAATETDPNPANNTALVNLLVVEVPVPNTDLVLNTAISPAPYLAGDNLTYTVTVTNQGLVAATNVVVTDLLPAPLTFVQAAANPGAYNAATGLYTVGTLQPGASAALSLTATINTSGPVVHSASVTGSPVDRDNTNNTHVLEVCVLPASPARLEINGSEQIRSVCTGETVEFKVPVVSGTQQYEYTFPPGFTVVRQLGSIITVRPGNQGGEVVVKTTNSCGSSQPLRVPVSVSVIPPPPAVPEGPAAPCSGSEAVYRIPAVADAAAYSWTLPADWSVLSGGTTTSVTVRVGATAGEVVAKAANVCGGGSTTALAVVPVLTPPQPQIADSSSACGGLRYAVAPQPGVSAYTWTVPDGWTITAGQGTAMITVQAPDAKARGTISVVGRQQDCSGPAASYQALASRGDNLLNLPNAFSPNGDNQNDTYVIGNLEKFPDNDILIINRWGNQVYKQVNYQNNWAATDLNDGTYFYVLRVKACNNEQKIYRGYITIAR
ncbi:MAG: gliding motility-associated C-terminal domain-containing protein [Adhaeribacter sp.]